MMGIMMPETCWVNNKFCNKEPSVASSWPFYFHVLTMMHGQTHIKFGRTPLDEWSARHRDLYYCGLGSWYQYQQTFTMKWARDNECVSRNPNDYSASSRAKLQDTPAEHSGVTATPTFQVRMGADPFSLDFWSWVGLILSVICHQLITFSCRVSSVYLDRVIALPSALVFRLRVRTNFFQSLWKTAEIVNNNRRLDLKEGVQVSRQLEQDRNTFVFSGWMVGPRHMWIFRRFIPVVYI